MERVINTYCAIAAVAIGLMLAYECIAWARFTPADWASWAQAIGTVAAIAATIWLATRDDRRRRQDAHDLAVLTAAAITFRLSTALANVRYIADLMDQAHKSSGEAADLGPYANYINAISICTDDEQARLIPLPSRCAYRLAGARDRLHAAYVTLSSMAMAQDRFNDARRKSAYGFANLALTEARNLLERATSICQTASHGVTGTHPD